MTDWPIAISTADDSISAGVCLWRQRQIRFATVAVKATFALVSGGTMTLRTPLPLEQVERAGMQSQGIEPGDLAPCLAQPEVWVRGHAWHPPAEGAPSVRVRLVFGRDGNALMRKSVEIPVQQDPFVPPFMHALAPLSRKWPVRTRLLGAFDWTALDRSPIELPDIFDWTYFQAAPHDQRLGPLRGDEWIRLEAMHSTIHKFDTQLPSASCAVMMFGHVEPFRHGVPLRIGLDTIQIDVDHGWCALVFRGHTPLHGDVRLEDLQFVAGLGLPDRPVPKLEPLTAASSKSAPPPPRLSTSQTPSVGETFAFDESVLRALTARDALPFVEGSAAHPAPNVSPARPREDKPPPGSAGETFAFDESLLDALDDALPFHESSSGSRSESPTMASTNEPSRLPVSLPVPDAPLPKDPSLPSASALPAQDVGSTFMLTDEMLAVLEGSAPTPFTGGDPLPERDVNPEVFAALPFQSASSNDRAPRKLGAVFLAALDDARRGRGNGIGGLRP